MWVSGEPEKPRLVAATWEKAVIVIALQILRETTRRISRCGSVSVERGVFDGKYPVCISLPLLIYRMSAMVRDEHEGTGSRVPA
jgi:hypothetical protein